MELVYKPSVVKKLKKIERSEAKKILRKLEALSSDPLVGKPLKGEFSGSYSLRAWPYRIVYEIKGKKIVVINIAHRQGVYK